MISRFGPYTVYKRGLSDRQVMFLLISPTCWEEQKESVHHVPVINYNKPVWH